MAAAYRSPGTLQVRPPMIGAKGFEPPHYSAAFFMITGQGLLRKLVSLTVWLSGSGVTGETCLHYPAVSGGRQSEPGLHQTTLHYF